MEMGYLITFQNAIFLVLDLYVLAKSFKGRNLSWNHRNFTMMAVFASTEQLASVFVRMLKAKILNPGEAVQYAVYMVMFIGMVLSAWCSMKYMLNVSNFFEKPSKTWDILTFIPCIVMSVSAVIAPWTHGLFYLDEDLNYVRGSLFFLQLVCPYTYAVIPLIVIFILLFRGRKGDAGHVFRYFLCFVAPAIAGMLIQVVLNVDGGYSSIGLSICLILLYFEFYVDEIREMERSQGSHLREELVQNNERLLALEDNFEAMYDVDLKTGKYDVVLKGQTFTENINDHLVEKKEFFSDAYENIDVVAFPDDREEFKKAITRENICAALEKDSHFDYYYRLMVEGEPVWFRMRVVYKDESRKNIIVGIFNASEDVEAKQIADQKEKLQAALNAAEIESQRVKMINGIIDSSDWVYEIDADDKVVSARYGDTINKKVDANSDDNPMIWIELVHPEDRDRVLKGFNDAISDHSGKTTYDEIFRLIDRDGNYRWSRSVGEVLRRSDGTGEYVGMSMDMTRQMEEQQKRLLGAMPLSNDVLTKANIGMWAFELDEGQPPRMYDDETMLGLVGLDHQVPPEEAYHAWYDNIDEGSYDLVTDAVNKMISGEHAEVQYPWHYPDGRTIIVRCGGIRNYEYTKGIRIEGTHQDVTQTLHFDEEERKREEQQRKDEIARIKAESSDKAKTEFLFNMSHDIRTPMNAILGYTDIAIRHADEKEKVSASLKKIRMAGGHLLSLINDILEMSRIEAGVLEITNSPVDIRKSIDSVDLMSHALAVPKSIDYHTIIGDIKDPYVYADELHINQIVINLISNAVKYTATGGKVEYLVEQTGDPVDGVAVYRLVVRDTGIGMSEEFQKHLFENFTRENDAEVSRQEGAGLGLSIVKRITDLAGGTISVESKKGEGSTFTVELPLRVMNEDEIEKYKAASREETDIKDSGLEGRKVLLVEDNEMNREIATEILEEAGLAVETAEDGEFALKTVIDKGTDYYDFILMDIQMPVMNGYEATKAIRALPGGGDIPIIALSANAFEEDRKKSLESGMNAHVAKPINIKTLLSTIKGLTK